MLNKKVQHLSPPGGQWEEIYAAKSPLALHELISSGMAVMLAIILLVVSPGRLSSDPLIKLGELAVIIGFGLWTGYICVTNLLDFLIQPKVLCRKFPLMLPQPGIMFLDH